MTINYLAIAILIILFFMGVAFGTGIAAELYFEAKYRNKMKFIGSLAQAFAKAGENMLGKHRDEDMAKIVELMKMMNQKKEESNDEA